MSNKAHRHSKRASNVDTNRAFKRVIITALHAAEFPTRAQRRAPLREAFAAEQAAKIAAREAAKAAAAAQAPQT
jgi:hypothetical protein